MAFKMKSIMFLMIKVEFFLFLVVPLLIFLDTCESKKSNNNSSQDFSIISSTNNDTLKLNLEKIQGQKVGFPVVHLHPAHIPDDDLQLAAGVIWGISLTLIIVLIVCICLCCIFFPCCPMYRQRHEAETQLFTAASPPQTQPNLAYYDASGNLLLVTDAFGQALSRPGTTTPNIRTFPNSYQHPSFPTTPTKPRVPVTRVEQKTEDHHNHHNV